MLEKFSKKNKIIFCDAHYHEEDLDVKNCFASSSDGKVIRAFGIHPQNPDLSLLPVLENLLTEKKLQAVGECGFDFYRAANCPPAGESQPNAPNSLATEELQSTYEIQSQVFLAQISLAQKYNLPVIIHCRRANEKLFEYSSELKKLPSVLFHSFMGTPTEAQSLLNRGINGYFSFGKQIFNGNKKVIQCVKTLPVERLLLETDAPFQTLKGEEKTLKSEIEKVYEGAFSIRDDVADFEKFSEILKNNFTACFCSLL